MTIERKKKYCQKHIFFNQLSKISMYIMYSTFFNCCGRVVRPTVRLSYAICCTSIRTMYIAQVPHTLSGHHSAPVRPVSGCDVISVALSHCVATTVNDVCDHEHEYTGRCDGGGGGGGGGRRLTALSNIKIIADEWSPAMHAPLTRLQAATSKHRWI